MMRGSFWLAGLTMTAVTMAAMLAALVLGGCNRLPFGVENATGTDDGEEIADDPAARDRYIEKSLAEDPYQEARKFLTSGGGLWAENFTREEIVRLVDECYIAGAKRVLFGGIEPEVNISAWLIVELPSDPARRQRVIDRFNQAMERSEEPPFTDQGQTFIDIALD